ncbi:acylphosphatase [Phenylobacterium sp.]|uniref:acylphosphatase n=1 Tax=Phenylobacterium sp. TaxID=1871053 RepID=UPI0025E004A2|nr:acylphosphatase [Phenylobacterium sp.]MBX3484532.1 acylphosphatase [Phenylobacterium sp.]
MSGHVQRVGFRWWVEQQAHALGLHGWCRNLRDGRVEVLVIGDPDAIQRLVEACRQGPPGAEVTSVEAEAAEDDGSRGFEQEASR